MLYRAVRDHFLIRLSETSGEFEGDFLTCSQLIDRYSRASQCGWQRTKTSRVAYCGRYNQFERGTNCL